MTNNQGSHFGRLSAIVPVYNERNQVGEVIRRMRQVELPESLELEIVLVDDGSTDGTDKVLSTLEDSTVRVLRHKTNLGKGAAIRTGVAEARGDVIVISDADLEYSAQDWPRLLAPILDGSARVVYGSRFHPERVSMSLTRLLANRGLSSVTCLLFNTTLTDVETGLKAFDRELLKSLELESGGFQFDVEVTAKLLRRKIPILEVPVRFSGSEEGRKYRPGDRLQALRTLLRERFKSRSK